jgi:hypothetical protein
MHKYNTSSLICLTLVTCSCGTTQDITWLSQTLIPTVLKPEGKKHKRWCQLVYLRLHTALFSHYNTALKQTKGHKELLHSAEQGWNLLHILKLITLQLYIFFYRS